MNNATTTKRQPWSHRTNSNNHIQLLACTQRTEAQPARKMTAPTSGAEQPCFSKCVRVFTTFFRVFPEVPFKRPQSPGKRVSLQAGSHPFCEPFGMEADAGAPPSNIPYREEHVLSGHRGAVMVVRFNKDGTYCMTGGKDKHVILWNPHNGLRVKVRDGEAC